MSDGSIRSFMLTAAQTAIVRATFPLPQRPVPARAFPIMPSCETRS